jgi:hypothetical protein
MVALELFTEFNCCVVFLGADLKERYYKGAAPWHCCSSHCAQKSSPAESAAARVRHGLGWQYHAGALPSCGAALFRAIRSAPAGLWQAL